MRSMITVCNVQQRVSPILQCTARLTRTYVDPAGEVRATQATAAAALPPTWVVGNRLSVRSIGAGVAMADGVRVGKSFNYQLTGEEFLVELSIMKQYAGKAPLRRSLYLRATPGTDNATIRLRCGSTLITVAKGPFQILTSREAKNAFLNAYKAGMAMVPEDYRPLGIEVETNQKQESVKAVATVDEAGQETRIIVRRRMRAVEV